MDTAARAKLKGFGLMFLSSSLMGGIGAFARYIDAPGEFISFFRSFSGLIGMSLFFLLVGGFAKVRATRFTPSIFFSGLFLGLLSALYVISTQYTTLANASFLIYTGPVYSTILATIFLKEPFRPAMIGSLGAVVVGTLLIVQIISGAGFKLDLDPKYAFGNIIGLLSGVAYGLYLFASRYRTDCDSNVRAWYNFLFAVVTIGVMVVVRWSQLTYVVREKVDGVPMAKLDESGNTVTAPWDLFSMDARTWAVLIVAALVTGFGAFYFLTLASKILLAGELATISYQETIMASLLGLAFFREHLSGMQMLGGLLIISGGVSQVYFSTRGKKGRTDKIRPEPGQKEVSRPQ